jgi:hypothetical protein
MRCRRIGVRAYRRTRNAEILGEASSLCFFLRPVRSGTLRLHESLRPRLRNAECGLEGE